MNLPNMEIWFSFQIFLEAVIVVFMVILFIRIRNLSAPGKHLPDNIDPGIEKFIEESKKLSDHFSENLAEKKELSLNLLLKLERKINELNLLLERAEKETNKQKASIDLTLPVDKENPAAPESRALVLKLSSKGMSVEEIARKAKLHRGEVELILDLERHFEI